MMGLVLALFLALAPQGAGAADPEYATIELRGSKSAYVDVRFDKATRINWGDEAEAPMTVRTGGTYAGYIVQRLSDDKIVAGAVRVPVMDFDDVDGDQDLPLLVLVKGDSGYLAGGAYRIHLVTDGRSTVRFPVEGLDESASYRPRDATNVTSSYKTPLLEPGEPVSHHRTPITVQDETLVVLASLLVADRSQASYLEHCVVQVVEPCRSRPDYSAAITINHTENLWSLSRIYSVYRPGHFEPGEWQAQFSAAAAGPVRRADTFVLTVDLVGEQTGTDGGSGTEPDPDPTADPGEDTDPSPRPHGSPDDHGDTSDGDFLDGSGPRAPAGDGSSIRPAPRSSLAATGVNAPLYVALALGLLILGALMIVVARRRVTAAVLGSNQ